MRYLPIRGIVSTLPGDREYSRSCIRRSSTTQILHESQRSIVIRLFKGHPLGRRSWNITVSPRKIQSQSSRENQTHRKRGGAYNHRSREPSQSTPKRACTANSSGSCSGGNSSGATDSVNGNGEIRHGVLDLPPTSLVWLLLPLSAADTPEEPTTTTRRGSSATSVQNSIPSVQFETRIEWASQCSLGSTTRPRICRGRPFTRNDQFTLPEAAGAATCSNSA